MMKTNYWALIAFGFVLVTMTIASGNYLYATVADFFFLGAGLAYRKQQRSNRKQDTTTTRRTHG